MKRNKLVAKIISTVLIWLALLTPVSAMVAEKKPNILFIMSDDHCARAIGAYQGRLAKLNPTPNLDRIAAEGIRFQNVFCTNSICTPSRAVISSGENVVDVTLMHARISGTSPP